jgi:hypothetical protein
LFKVIFLFLVLGAAESEEEEEEISEPIVNSEGMTVTPLLEEFKELCTFFSFYVYF